MGRRNLLRNTFDFMLSSWLGPAKPLIELIQIGKDVGLARLDILDRGEEGVVLLPGPHPEQEGSIAICPRSG